MRATLTVMGGLPDQAGRSFEIGPETTTLGRGLACDVQLADQSISRLHAELVWEGERLVLVHKSQVNRTLVNGVQVTDRLALSGGEEIQLAVAPARPVAGRTGRRCRARLERLAQPDQHRQRRPQPAG